MFKIIATNKKEADFVFSCDVAYANALRRIILSEIPNIAVADDIKISINTTSMHNDFLSKRILLVPLCFEPDDETFDQLTFSIDKTCKGPNDHLTTDDIVIKDEQGQNIATDVILPRSEITNDPILLAWMDAGQRVQLEFKADQGIQLTHAKYCPVSTCTYFNTLDDVAVKLARSKVPPEELNKFDTLDQYRLFKKNEYGEACSFTFRIESECRLTPTYLVDKALTVLKAKLLGLEKKIKIDPIDASNRLYAITVKGEDHTIGNLFQVFIYNNYVRKERIVDFVGYFQPHPLDPDIVFKIRFLEGKDDIPRFWGEAIRLAAASMEDVRVEWGKASSKKPSASKKKLT